MTYAGILNLKFLSEWHCGTGAGKHGGLDRTIALDDEGLPYIPGRTIKGMWRDACERVGHALDDGSDGEWSLLVRRLFGDPSFMAKTNGSSRSLVHTRDGHVTSAWRERILGEESDILLPGLRVARAGVTIADKSGTAKPDHLRHIEFARRSLELEAQFKVDVPKDHWAITLILGAGLKELRALGSHRRRGAGRCEASSGAFDDLSQLVQAHQAEIASWRTDSIQWPRRTLELNASPVAASAEPLVRAGRVFLTLRQPVAATRAVMGNLMLSHDFVPGSTLLPLVAKELGELAPSLIRAGNLIVTDAVPTPGADRLSRSPLSLVSSDKGNAWLSDKDEVCDARDRVRDSSDRPVGNWTYVRDDGMWRIFRSSLVTLAHGSIDDSSQRTLENGVYTIQAIPVGIRLAFDVWLPREHTHALKELPEHASIGRYRDDSYGLVDIDVADPPASQALPDIKEGATFSLWLTSDACIETSDGIPDTTPGGFVEAVKQALAKYGAQPTLSVVEKSTFATVVRRDSWTGRISLPRQTITGLGAGSVITLKTGAHIPGDALRKALDRGIGQRRVEGFGRCELLPAASKQDIRTLSRETAPPASFRGTPTGEIPSWNEVRRAIWRTEIQQRIQAIASSPDRRTELLPKDVSASNLGTLRTAAIALPADNGSIDRWLARAGNQPGRRADSSGSPHPLVALFSKDALEDPTKLYAWLRKHQAASELDVHPG